MKTTEEIATSIAALFAAAGVEASPKGILDRLLVIKMNLEELYDAAQAVRGREDDGAKRIRAEWRIRTLERIQKCKSTTELVEIIKLSPRKDDEINRCTIIKADVLIASESAQYALLELIELAATGGAKDECADDGNGGPAECAQAGNTYWRRRLKETGTVISERHEEGPKTGHPKTQGKPGVFTIKEPSIPLAQE